MDHPFVSFTNQPGISAGKASKQEFVEELKEFGFDDTFICPHDRNERCHCRKPNTGMLIAAAEKHELDLKKCVVIGDRWSDIVAADKVKSMKILVKTGAGQSAITEHYDRLKNIKIDYLADNLNDAVNWLYQHFQIKKES
ncbi:HAD-IIIA family hydrolase [Jeotgalibacillus marinus]|uniref:HAD-IIIA family hydrolase n=1 Tax=Jeotgalibacillus marinus TaxID=86667 RepID=A0ABV3Q561_9BACL